MAGWSLLGCRQAEREKPTCGVRLMTEGGGTDQEIGTHELRLTEKRNRNSGMKEKHFVCETWETVWQ